MSEIALKQLAINIKHWGQQLGFQQVAITDTDLSHVEPELKAWLAKNYHGSMNYMAQNIDKRLHPEQLVPNTQRIIIVRLNYLPDAQDSHKNLQDSNRAYISRYALGRDYHKLIRKRLGKLADKITEFVGDFSWRPFADSAPVMEKPLAAKAGIGWQGKNTLILNREAGSWFFLGSLFISLPLPIDQPVSNHCGSCSACIDICPTNAIVGPYQLDARRCISYLTIENKQSIPLELRPLMGNRIYGCDDCQLICPWNKYATRTNEDDFQPRHQLDSIGLIDAFNWTEEEFLAKTQGSAIRRAGYEGWLRNVAVALGNAPSSAEIISALNARSDDPSDLVREHVRWALEKQILY